MYITPTLGGSRTGAGIAAAWASMLHIGEDRYRDFARVLVEAKDQLVAGIAEIDGLRVQGRADVMVVAMESTTKDLNIHAVGSALGKSGWHLNSLQNPAGIHIALTLANCERVPELLADLRVAVQQARESPDKGGAVALYGMSAVAPAHLLEDAGAGVLDLCFKTRPSERASETSAAVGVAAAAAAAAGAH